MPESGLYPVQTWLWSELDDLGIDGVIYSRHILDLLISSKHTFDYRLDEKEQNIFSKIAPSAKKRKHKYSRRSSSFSACEEILWKKEIAVACLLSAAETKTDSEDTAVTIKHVVDELYSKLAGLHLTSGERNVSSDGDCPLTDHNGNSVPRKKPQNREKYEEAFPSLDGTKGSPVPNNFSDTVWKKTDKINGPKSGCDSDNSLNPTTPDPDSGQESHVRNHGNGTKKGRFSSHAGSRFAGDAVSGGTKRPNHSTCAPLCPRNTNRRFLNTRKPRAASTGCSDFVTPSYNFQPLKKSSRSRYSHGCRFQPKYRKSEGQKKKNGEKMSPQKRKFTDSKDTAKRSENLRRGNSKFVKKDSRMKTTENDVEISEQDYAHLPSWMETTLADFSNPYIWSAYESFGIQENNAEDAGEEEEGPKEMPFSNRWYRDPDSGLLTFQPLSCSKARESTSSSSTLSRPASSICEDEEEDELFQDDQSDPGTPAAPESWMWCPSPSLWEDGQTSPVSRLESVYKRELLSLGAENHADDISGRIWEEYKTIFLDLRDMDPGSDDETTTSEDEQSVFEHPDSSIWAPSEIPQTSNRSGFSTDSEKVADLRLGLEAMGREFDLWSKPTFGGVQRSVLRNSSYDSLATSSIGEPMIHKSSSEGSNIWKYSTSPVQAWSVDDGLNHHGTESEHFTQPDEELALLMQNGAFGYLCQSKKSDWNLLPQNGGQRLAQSQWGGGDMPVMEKPDTPKETYEERMMHTLVDALFSDLSFELLFGPDDGDPGPSTGMPNIPSATPTTPFDPEFPSSLSFDFRSLFLQTPIENFNSAENNPWQPRWDMDDVVSHAGLTNLSPFTKLDDLFMSLASAEERDRQYGRLGETAQKKKTFYDSVTENEAWKTSLRIGNIWQTISGIRPVNVIYSENKPGPRPDEKLIPSSATHFRPISTEADDTPGYDSIVTIDTPLTSVEPDFNDTGQDLNQCNMADINNSEMGQTYRPPELPEEPSFQTNFSKLVQDKSMQTAFEISVQQDIASCQEFLPRPPKANSR